MSNTKKCFFTYRYFYSTVIPSFKRCDILDFLKALECACYISPLHFNDSSLDHYHVLVGTDRRNVFEYLSYKSVKDPGEFILSCEDESCFCHSVPYEQHGQFYLV